MASQPSLLQLDQLQVPEHSHMCCKNSYEHLNVNLTQTFWPEVLVGFGDAQVNIIRHSLLLLPIWLMQHPKWQILLNMTIL